MNKKFLLAGFVVAAGFITLTAFGGKTKEQQQQEIATAITAQLDEFRAQKQQECTDMVYAEAQRRYDEYVASLPPVKATKPGSKKSTAKKPSAVTPLPQTPPAQSPKQDKMQQTPTNTEGKQEKMMQPPTNTEGKKSKMQKTQEGGGGK